MASGNVTTSVYGFAGWQIASPKQSLPASGSLAATARVVYAIWVDQNAAGDNVLRFAKSDDGGYSYVIKQPESQDDIDLCMEALEGCPVEAIGDDGDE